jgi:formate hydrogenlyase subunit 6/NADH:ubiquinone oxidoreductase subunit I
MPLDVVRRLLTPLREPVVTSRYPDAPPLLQPALRGLPEVDPTRCDREAACVSACPTAAINVSDDGWSIDAGRCVFCSACALACPHGAIRLGPRVELAATDRATLVVVTPLEARR